MDSQKTPPGQTPNDNDDPSSASPHSAQGSTSPLTDSPTGEAEEPSFAPQAGETIKPGPQPAPGGQPDAVPTEPTTATTSPITESASSSPAPGVTPSAPAELFAKDAPAPLPVSAPTRSKKGLLLGAIIAVVVLLGGGASAAYYYVANTPENVLKRALAHALDAEKTKTVQFSGVLSVDDSTSDTDIEASFKGAASNETGAFDVSSSLDVFVANLTFDARSTDGKTYYVKLGGLDGLSQLLSGSSSAVTSMDAAMLGIYAPILDSVNDQWLEINQSLIKQITGTSAGKTLSDADRQKLVEAYKQHSFIVIKQMLADESIKGVNSHHYKVVIDKATLKSFVGAIKAAKIEALEITDKQLQQFNAELDKAKFDKYPVDVWIAKDTKMINQVAMQFEADGDTMTLRLTVDSYNQPVKVEKPADAKSLLEVMGEFMGGSFSGGSESMFYPKPQSGTLNPESGISL